MQVIFSFSEYIGKLENSFLYEDIKNLQRVIDSLFNRDKNILISYCAINKEIQGCMQKNFLSISKNESLSLSIYLTDLVKNWDGFIDKIQSINNLILISNQYNQYIEYHSIKIIHYAYQSMVVNEVERVYKDLFENITSDLSHLPINFSAEVEAKHYQDTHMVRDFKNEINNQQSHFEQRIKGKEKKSIEREELGDNVSQVLDTNLRIEKMICHSCHKVYPSYYSSCLRCGESLTRELI